MRIYFLTNVRGEKGKLAGVGWQSFEIWLDKSKSSGFGEDQLPIVLCVLLFFEGW